MIERLTCKKYLRMFGYKAQNKGLQKILDTWQEAKAPLLEKFRQDPNWNEDNLAIVIKNSEYPKQFNRTSLVSFKDWAVNKKRTLQISKSTEDKAESYYINKLDDIRAMVRYARNNNKKVEIEGKDVLEIQTESEQEYTDYQTRTANLYKVNEDDEKSYFITEELRNKIDKVYNALVYISNSSSESNVTAEQATKINEYININAVEGQKLSRVINKLCSEIGLNEIRETQTTTNDEGEEITREVGYQHHFNVMAQEVTSRNYKVHTVISLNPIDYWGMSIGYKWSSCQGIDIFNVGNRHHAYSGQWSGGTESLMLDPSTVVFYTIAEDYDGNMYYINEKLNRCLFSINEQGTLLVQHVTYPDARDGGDQNKITQYRNIMQELVARLWGHENKWTLKKDNYYMRDYLNVTGIHYKDTTSNGACTLSLLKGVSDYGRVNIGADAICPVCGKVHTNTGNIMCYECRYDNYKREFIVSDIFTRNDFVFEEDNSYVDEVATENTELDTNEVDRVYCEHCTQEIERNNALYINGHYYCNTDCAENAGWHEIDGDYYNEESGTIIFTENNGWQLTSETYTDAYEGLTYYGNPAVITQDGNKYYSEDNAYEDGYERCYDDGLWYDRNNMLYSERYDGFRCHADCINIDYDYYWDEDDARDNGFTKTLNDEWALIEECFYDEFENGYCRYDDSEAICINDRYYASKESAEHDGYVMYESEWVREDELNRDSLTGVYFRNEEAEVVTEDGNYFLYESAAIDAGYKETENGWIKIERASA